MTWMTSESAVINLLAENSFVQFWPLRGDFHGVSYTDLDLEAKAAE